MAVAPWTSPRAGYVYPPEVEKKIRALTENGKCFLNGATGSGAGAEAAATADREFSIERYKSYLEGAIKHDHRLSQWQPKLVPKRVSEELFWRNYFSHVQSILAQRTFETATASNVNCLLFFY